MAETSTRAASAWRPVMPIPEDTPPPRFTHGVYGEPRRVFAYKDAEGRVLGYVCRFLRSAGGTHVSTRTWCVNEADRSHAWRWIQFPRMRPVYGAQKLAAKGETAEIVLVVADELCAEELQRVPQFSHLTIVSWPGGRTKLGEVDWSLMRERVVWCWFPHSAERFKVAKGDPQAGEYLPVAKQPWRAAAARLRATLREYGAMAFAEIAAETTEELPDGWDPLYALNNGWTEQQLYEWWEKHLVPGHERQAIEQLNAATAQPGGVSGDWTKTLLRKDDSGRLLPELHNARLILMNHADWQGVIYEDLFAHTVMKAKPPPFEGGAVGEWTDTDDSMAADWLAMRCGIQKLRTSTAAEAVQAIAHLRARNPLVEYLKGLKWDGKRRLKKWLIKYLNAWQGDADTTEAEAAHLKKYLSIVGRKWMIGAVARALNPGVKMDNVLILEGMQGLGKSGAFQILGGEWAMDTPFSLGDKEGMEAIRGVWIIEIPELDSFNKATDNTAKSFFSRSKDRFRLPYGKRSVTFKRNSVFGGTTNENEYFRDPTGSRRYWPVKCHKDGYDQEKLQAVRDQLWAEAVVAYISREQHWPTRSESEVIKREQDKREILDPWTSIIASWLRGPESQLGAITRERVMREALAIEAGRLDERSMATRVGRAMHRLGYERKEDKTIPERFRYEKPASQEQGAL